MNDSILRPWVGFSAHPAVAQASDGAKSSSGGFIGGLQSLLAVAGAAHRRTSGHSSGLRQLGPTTPRIQPCRRSTSRPGWRRRAQVVGGLRAAQPGELVVSSSFLPDAPGHVDVQDCAWSIHFWRRGGFHQPLRSRSRRRWRRAPVQASGTRSMRRSEPSKCFRSMTITSSHRPRSSGRAPGTR